MPWFRYTVNLWRSAHTTCTAFGQAMTKPILCLLFFGGMQEKAVRYRNLHLLGSLFGFTRPSLVMPNTDPQDGNFCPYQTAMKGVFPQSLVPKLLEWPRLQNQFGPDQILIGPRPGVPVYLAPWAACPPGVKIPAGSLPPPGGGKISRGIFTPTLGILPPTVFKIKFVFFDTNFNDKKCYFN